MPWTVVCMLVILWCEKLDRTTEILSGCRHVGLHIRGVELSGKTDSDNPQSTPKGVAWVFCGVCTGPKVFKVAVMCVSTSEVWSCLAKQILTIPSPHRQVRHGCSAVFVHHSLMSQGVCLWCARL